ncbi:hypothetical protein OQH61_02205 [Helicobacter sp. MIT 21-1697]|uniref:hypothetical protein n=1 Tax=Helicobacter sp. MIT 21-1697 TaxID=2993733 RepID=UPI00224A89F4|nr:hypothetical protein [Helicobacter sp. MIT 21-1697]MCX2716542.1 hypothetical protein [Helicobacter sp. MIT 21-1697]
MLAPIVLFAYNRPIHLQQTIKSLIANPLSKKSHLFIYADGIKENATIESKQAVSKVQDYIQSLKSLNTTQKFFNSITIKHAKHNLGLADSIINGTSEIMHQFGRAIILEDDIVTSPVFLDYMNASLEQYKNKHKVWSISGWSYPIEVSGLGDCYFWRIPHCWGWASWNDRWIHFKRDTSWALKNFDKKDIDYINLDGVARYFEHLIANHQGKIKTWAIFNYLISYKHSALTLCPNISYIKQIGFDGSGIHCGKEGNIYNPTHINIKFPITYPHKIIESHLALERIKAFEQSIRKPLHTRAYSKMLNLSSIFTQKAKKLMGGGAELKYFYTQYHNLRKAA